MALENCIFCKIVNKQIPSQAVYETDEILAFSDISPQAPVHIVIIPKEHISSPYEINHENSHLAGKLIASAAKIAKGLNLNGYRLVFNCNEIAGQTVFHIHCHLLGGRQMDWPPG